ncbi:MAG: YhcH/YjgK/YiaL family protein [Bacteroidota bacterium]
MILDTLDQIRKYSGTLALFHEAVAFLENADLLALPEGKIEIRGDSLYATVTNKQGKGMAEAFLEAHRRYADIHILLSGEEQIGWRPVNLCTGQKGPYEPATDVMFFDDSPLLIADLKPKMFAVFLPHDCHAPMISGGIIHKIVMKLLLG